MAAETLARERRALLQRVAELESALLRVSARALEPPEAYASLAQRLRASDDALGHAHRQLAELRERESALAELVARLRQEKDELRKALTGERRIVRVRARRSDSPEPRPEPRPRREQAVQADLATRSAASAKEQSLRSLADTLQSEAALLSAQLEAERRRRVDVARLAPLRDSARAIRDELRLVRSDAQVRVEALRVEFAHSLDVLQRAAVALAAKPRRRAAADIAAPPPPPPPPPPPSPPQAPAAPSRAPRLRLRVVCCVRPVLSREWALARQASRWTAERVSCESDLLPALSFPSARPNTLCLGGGASAGREFRFERVISPEEDTATALAALLQPWAASMLLPAHIADGDDVGDACAGAPRPLCVVATGQAGSGKSRSVRLLIVEAARVLLRAAADASCFALTVAVDEVYNDQQRRLLGEGVVARSVEEVLALVDAAAELRRVGASAVNEHSSRSHLVVRLRVGDAASNPRLYAASEAVFADLAGPERLLAARSASCGGGNALSETQHINSSVAHLGSVLAALAASVQRHVPFRDVTLTRLLRDPLRRRGCECLVLCHVTPVVADAAETLNTLEFAERLFATPPPVQLLLAATPADAGAKVKENKGGLWETQRSAPPSTPRS